MPCWNSQVPTPNDVNSIPLKTVGNAIQARASFDCRTEPGTTAKHAGGRRGSKCAVGLPSVAAVTRLCAGRTRTVDFLSEKRQHP